MKKFWLFILVYSMFAGLFIFNTSKVVNGERYFFLADDAMISMQYAKNFVAGNGLVWSVGERVQGFTNPLWTMYMTIPHFLNIPHSKCSLFIQLTAYLFMIGTLFLIWKMSENIVVLVFVGFFLPLNHWFYSGLEVSILTFLCTLVSYLTAKKKYPYLIFLLCGLMIWIRIDMTLFFMLIILQFRDERVSETAVCLLVFFVCSLLVWSKLNYGDWLPNTYYLKMYHYPLWMRLCRGVATVGLNFFTMNWIVFGLAFMSVKTNRTEKLILSFFVLEVLYSVYIGGDVWEAQGGTNRFITLAIPLVFMMLVQIIDKTIWHLNIYSTPVKIAIFCLIFINLNMLMSKPQSLGKYFLPTVETLDSENTLKIALKLKPMPHNLVIATQGAGVLPYFSEQPHYIDLHGKCDKVIAHGEITGVHSLWDVFTTAPGHIKYNQAYSIIQLQPDIIVHPINDGMIDWYLKKNYEELYKDTWIKKGIK